MPKPAIRHKTFRYNTGVRWTGDRNGVLSSTGKPGILVSSPPEFKGTSGRWTPEDFLVAAVELCAMTTFMAFSQKKGIEIRSYASSAEGIMEFSDGGYRLMKIRLLPVIEAAAPATAAEVERILADAHRSCIITNSIVGDVVLDPVITVTL
jgi:organic hydroperoxide reductase OsmC/OhrA